MDMRTEAERHHTCKHTVASVLQCDIVDELHDDDGLSDTRSTEETNLTTLGIWRKQVDNLEQQDRNPSS